MQQSLAAKLDHSLPDPETDGETGVLTTRILEHLWTRHTGPWSLLIDGSPPAEEDMPLQDLNDLVYSLHFLGWPVRPGRRSRSALLHYLSNFRLAGDLDGGDGRLPVSVHGTAYTLSTLTLLKTVGLDLFDEVLTPSSWRFDQLIDPQSQLPRWPAKWSHHNWRVSHWIGGSLSIMRELSRHMQDAYRDSDAPSIDQLLEASDRLIDADSGVLKCYRSRLLQQVFRQAYRLRHDPTLGDVGGVVHVHWVNYAEGRSFKAGRRLFETASRLMLERRPFMESVPYCLDFDVVQILRTAMPVDLGTDERQALNRRASDYASEVARYLDNHLGPDYALHKLPGALATIHECALIDRSISLADLGFSEDIMPIDIMKETSWL